MNVAKGDVVAAFCLWARRGLPKLEAERIIRPMTFEDSSMLAARMSKEQPELWAAFVAARRIGA